jgi:hypothetical protein
MEITRRMVGRAYGESMHLPKLNTCFGEFVVVVYQLGFD